MMDSLHTMYDDWELLKATPVTTGGGFGLPAEARPAIAAAAVRSSIMRLQVKQAIFLQLKKKSSASRILYDYIKLVNRSNRGRRRRDPDLASAHGRGTRMHPSKATASFGTLKPKRRGRPSQQEVDVGGGWGRSGDVPGGLQPVLRKAYNNSGTVFHAPWCKGVSCPPAGADYLGTASGHASRAESVLESERPAGRPEPGSRSRSSFSL
eukprot:COSAG06_NODE_631_length_13616_cov_6.997411_4_plen_209_part_00